MLTQFFGKPFWITLGSIALVFLLAIGIFQTPLAITALLVIGATVFALSLWRLEFGVFVAFAELISQSHGHLIASNGLSLRMIIFVAVMCAWFVGVFLNKRFLDYKHPLVLPFVALIVLVFYGMVRGMVAYQSDLGLVFQDANAYFYLLYLAPILAVNWTSLLKRQLLQVFVASSLWVSIVTLGTVFVFSHFPEFMLGDVYTFLRDTRLAEITKMVESIWRVFMPAQIFSAFLLFLFMPFLWMKELKTKEYVVLSSVQGVAIATLIVSLSRSFWVGLLVAGVVWIALLLRSQSLSWWRVRRAVSYHVLSILVAVSLIAIALFFPVSYQQGSALNFASLFAERTTGMEDVAISSRWNLLDPMIETIAENPVIGSGFGTQVSFKTDDPRAIAMTGDGIWTTHAMEWGWFELWIKMGIAGPLLFGWLFVIIFFSLTPLLFYRKDLVSQKGFEFTCMIRCFFSKTEPHPAAWLAIGLISSLVMLYATHTFSPYLNHPIGLGMLMFVVPFVSKEMIAKEQEVVVGEKEKVKKKKTKRKIAPATAISSK